MFKQYLRSQNLNLTHFEQVVRANEFVRMHTGVGDVWCPKCNLNPSLSPAIQYQGSIDAFAKICRTEGAQGLWRGLAPALLMAVPNTACYFTAYDYLRHHVHEWQAQRPRGVMSHEAVAPLAAGTAARALTTTLISPLELLRTRAQTEGLAGHGEGPVRAKGMMDMLRAQLRAGGWRSLFKGLSSSLMRDVPFSAVYWVTVEAIRARLDAAERAMSVWAKSFVAGAAGGALAATLTHPFDLLKTRRQMTLYALPGSSFGDALDLSTAATLRKIVAEEGPRGLFIGLGPRVVKIVPACAIMISTYDWAKGRLASAKLRRKEGV